MTKLLPTQTTDTMWKKSIVFKSALTLLCLFVFQAGSLFGQVNRGITYTDTYLYGSYPATGAYTGGYQWSTSTDEVFTAA